MAQRLGISYSRLSDPSQVLGDGERRQRDAFLAFCRTFDLTPADETFIDRGRSGFKGDHRKKGDFGRLIDLAKTGHFPPGTVIVVEAWDRLGRLRPDRQVALVAELLRTGVDIGICRLSDSFTEADFGTHKWTTLAVFAQLAHQESVQKSDRVHAAWVQKKKRARLGQCQRPTEAMGAGGVLLTSRVPAWVRVVNGKPELVPEKALVVKLVFRLAAEGWGVQRITSRLVRDKVPPLHGDGWDRSYVARLLRNRAARGEYQPMAFVIPEKFRLPDGKAKAGWDGNKVRVKDGEPVKDYFPAAVTEEEYNAARAGAEGRKHQRQPRGDDAKLNLFARLVRDAKDGSAFFLTARPKRSGHRQTGGNNYVLQNLASTRGESPCRSLPYDVFEEAVLRLLREVDPKAVVKGKGTAPDAVVVLEGKLAELDAEIGKLKARLATRYSDAVADVLQDKEASRPALEKQKADAQWASAHPPGQALARARSLLPLAADPDTRPKLAAYLRRAISEIRLLVVARGRTRLAAVQIFFAGSDLRRDYLILHTPPYANRVSRVEARTHTCSLAGVAAPGELDLRQKSHSERLEKALAVADLSDLA
jgi:DNA invertase Pin-like site-specific DNA recombinase